MHVQHCAHSQDHSLPSDTQIYSVHLSLKHLQVQVGTYKNDDTAACLEAKSLYCLSRNFACVEDMEDSSLLVVLLGGALVVILNNQDLMLCARPFVHFLLVIQCSSPSSSNDQKSTQDLASLFAPARSFVSGCIIEAFNYTLKYHLHRDVLTPATYLLFCCFRGTAGLRWLCTAGAMRECMTGPGSISGLGRSGDVSLDCASLVLRCNVVAVGILSDPADIQMTFGRHCACARKSALCSISKTYVAWHGLPWVTACCSPTGINRLQKHGRDAWHTPS